MTSTSVTPPSSRPSRLSRLAPWAIVVIHGALTALLASRHEPWRDEVRALLIATRTPTLAAFRELMATEGHPALWHLLLRALHAVTGTDLVLPVLAWAAGVAAVALVAFRAPWPVWLRGLFALGLFPLWEYSVVARPYGLGMAIAFAYCAVAPRRAEHPWAPAVALALLVQTSVHGAVVAAALGLAWAIEERARWRRHVAPLGLVALSLALCAWQVAPPPDSLIAAERAAPTSAHVAAAFRDAIVRPGDRFPVLPLGGAPMLRLPGVDYSVWLTARRLATVALVIAAIALLRRPALLAALVSGTVALSVLFTVVYPGAPRHQGQLFVLLVALAWLAMQRGTPSVRGRRLAVGALGVLFALHASRGLYAASRDWRLPHSSSAALAEWLETEAPDAVVLAEPDYFVESLLVHREVETYLVREGRWGPSPRWTTRSIVTLPLGTLHAEASRVSRERGRPVAIVMVDDRIGEADSGSTRSAYGRTLTWTPAERAAFLADAPVVARIGGAFGDENYVVRLLASDAPRHAGPTPGRRSTR